VDPARQRIRVNLLPRCRSPPTLFLHYSPTISQHRTPSPNRNRFKPRAQMLLVLSVCATFAATLQLNPLALPNCIGCFDAKTGMCQLDTDADRCTLDPTKCPVGTIFVNNSMDAWPTGCLVELDAAGANCMPLLFKHQCNGGVQIADSLEHCKEMATQSGAGYIGWGGNPDGTNWPLPPGERALSCLISNGATFEAGCAGCEGCEYWTYYQLSTGSAKASCAYPASKWTCIKDASGPVCMPDIDSTMNASSCAVSCRKS
jgi:hypothetical protein